MSFISEFFRDLREKGLENTIFRYYGDYLAVVTDDADPQQQGRVKVKVDSLGFNQPHGTFARPVSPYAGENYGFYFPPHAGERVLVSFDHGDISCPRVSGAWWLNPGGNPRARKVERRPEYSHIPAEFRKEAVIGSDGKPRMPSTTARGIKTKGGHGLIFEDEVDKQHVEIWTGRNKSAGQPADRRHRFRMDDTTGNEEIVLTTFGGHKTTWRDAAGEVYISTTTKGGHELLLDDTGQKILIKSKDGYQVLLDDGDQKIEVKTKGGHTATMSDADKKVSIETSSKHSVTLDDKLQQIGLVTASKLRQILMDDKLQQTLVQNSPGQSVAMGPAGTTVTEPGAATVIAGGVLSLTGAGVAIMSAGGGATNVEGTGISNEKFTGLKTSLLLGGFVQTIVGLWQTAATMVNIVSATIELGSGGTKYFLVTEKFLEVFMAHTHNVTALGAPSGPPLNLLSPIVLVPGVHFTQHVKAS